MTSPDNPKAPAAGKPLDGLRVLDFTRVLAGPYCTALLADLGADVLKIEPPHGDDYRHIGPFYKDGSSALFETVNRGKRSVVLDLSDAKHRDLALDLVAGADVVVENFRPGVAEKLGVGWEQVRARNPRVVYASISGFGQDGPNARRPAYDIVVQALSGIMTVTGEPDGAPTLIGESIADVATGLFASWSILAALYDRERTGAGGHIDVSMFESMVALQPLVVARYLSTGQVPKRVGNRHPLSAPFGAFYASDKLFVLAVLNTKLFEALMKLIERPELAADPRFATDSDRLANEGALRTVIEAWSMGKSAADAVAALVAAGVPAAEVSDMASALHSDQARARSSLQHVAHAHLGDMKVPEQPARFDGALRGGLAAAAPLGAHTAQALADPQIGLEGAAAMMPEADRPAVEAIEKFCRTILEPRAAAIDAEAEFAVCHLSALAAIGLMGLNLPERWGGAGVNAHTLFEGTVAMAGACASTASMVTAHWLATDSILHGGDDAQRGRWLPKAAEGKCLSAFGLTEPDAGSNPADMTTFAERRGDSYRIKGRKQFISNAAAADFIVVYAKTDRDAGARGISAFVVEPKTGGVEFGPAERTMGLRGGHIFEVVIDIEVPQSHRLGPEGSGFRTALKVLDAGRLEIAACCIGIAEAAMMYAKNWLKTRNIGGVPIAEFQGLQWMLADMATDIAAARALGYMGALKRARGERFSLEGSMAKLYASEMVGRVTDKALQMHGGYGYTRDFPLERLVRDARIMRIYEGSSEVQRNIIARSVLS